MLLKEGIETMMDVILEILVWGNLGKYLFDDMLVIVENLVKRVGTEIISCKQIKELPK